MKILPLVVAMLGWLHSDRPFEPPVAIDPLPVTEVWVSRLEMESIYLRMRIQPGWQAVVPVLRQDLEDAGWSVWVLVDLETYSVWRTIRWF